MKKIIVIGCPGSGKSTFAIKLHEITKTPLFHLDMMYWNPDKTTVDKSVFLDKLSQLLDEEDWIIDGNYSSTLEVRLKKCDTVFFLDFPTEVCIEGIRSRRGKSRPDMPWIENEEDEEFLEFVRNFISDTRPYVNSLLEKYSDKDIHVFKSREDAEYFLCKLG